MTSSLVGSEMCIRDRVRCVGVLRVGSGVSLRRCRAAEDGRKSACCAISCLLYTSDAADDM
eukprot:12774919-Prorocentrum_lima.AAC.1